MSRRRGSTVRREVESEQRQAQLIPTIYAAIDEPGGWTAFLESSNEALGMSQANFTIHYHSTVIPDVACMVGVDPETVRRYTERWAAEDPWVGPRAPHMEVGRVYASHELCPDEVLERTDTYRSSSRH